ncbi:hypothetical protein D9M72_392900 [compost metagenome]
MAAMAASEASATRSSIDNLIRQRAIASGVRMMRWTSRVLNDRTGSAVRSASRIRMA